MIGNTSDNLRIGVAPGGAGSGDTYIRTSSSNLAGGNIYIGSKNYGSIISLNNNNSFTVNGRFYCNSAIINYDSGVSLKKYAISGTKAGPQAIAPYITFTFQNYWFSAKLWCLSCNDENSNNLSVLTSTLLGGNVFANNPSDTIKTVDTNVVTNGIAPWSSTITTTQNTVTITNTQRPGTFLIYQ